MLAAGLTEIAGARGERDFTAIEAQPKGLVSLKPQCCPNAPAARSCARSRKALAIKNDFFNGIRRFQTFRPRPGTRRFDPTAAFGEEHRSPA